MALRLVAAGWAQLSITSTLLTHTRTPSSARLLARSTWLPLVGEVSMPVHRTAQPLVPKPATGPAPAPRLRAGSSLRTRPAVPVNAVFVEVLATQAVAGDDRGRERGGRHVLEHRGTGQLPGQGQLRRARLVKILDTDRQRHIGLQV